ncbi:undecaprenyl-diphosphate phosphatase [Candidatus Roizmanbacteria bacterium]|nr:undecaprenyl-diphosphate phosphatase [Candidatus Roizmanbacteria bacterium]
MNIVSVTILGVVEGVTEFLPISSTAHLILVSKFLNLPQTDFQKFFEVFIQSGAILPVLVLYAGYLLRHRDVVGKVLVSFVPTAAVGFFFFRTIKSVFFESIPLMLGMLFLIGALFLLLEYFIEKKHIRLTKTLNHLSYSDAILIGLVQSIAIMPGVSRAGIILVGMMVLGYRRHEAAIYSFLLAIPTIFAASALDLYKSRDLLFGFQSNVLLLSVGFIVSFFTAYLSVEWFITHLKTKTLHLFGFYRIAVAIILLVSVV